MKILVAEDDLTSRRRLEAMLTKWGYEVVSCSNGKQAWERLQNAYTPKLAILDWVMPEMGGIEVCRRLRTLDTQNPVYVLLLTARKEKENIVCGLEAGADDYIIKPFEPDELQARIPVLLPTSRIPQGQLVFGHPVREPKRDPLSKRLWLPSSV